MSTCTGALCSVDDRVLHACYCARHCDCTGESVVLWSCISSHFRVLLDRKLEPGLSSSSVAMLDSTPVVSQRIQIGPVMLQLSRLIAGYTFMNSGSLLNKEKDALRQAR